jgi:hypothetical protein
LGWFCFGFVTGVLHGCNHLDHGQHFLRCLLPACFGQAGKEIVRMVRIALARCHAVGDDRAELAGAEVFCLAIFIEPVQQRGERAIAVAAELMPAEAKIKPGEGPEFNPAQRLGGFSCGFSPSCFFADLKNRL